MKTRTISSWGKKDSITMGLYRLMSFDKDNRPYIKIITKTIKG